MRLGFSLGTLLQHNEVLRCARLADEHGAESIWIPESWGREAFVTLGAISALTKRVRLGTGIVGIYSRSAASIAMAAATLDVISSGRAVLGLGASSKAIVENWHGMNFTHHIERMKEYVELMRLIFRGEKASYNGKFSRVNNFKLGFKPLRERIPIYVAAVNERMLDLASSIADGAILFLRPIDDLKQTAKKLNNIDVACVIMTAVSTDPDAARERVRKTIAFYVSVGRIYSDFLASHGFADEVEQVMDEYGKNGLENTHKFISDGMLDSIAVAGSPEECRKRLQAFIDAGVKLPIIQFNPVGETENSFKQVLTTLMVQA
jgi:alkanesulfonate monooxygenase SsuD/methylene tetrahydromethanopterin reductase-like flavin-dependent oxidoreductase (luciferase family)